MRLLILASYFPSPHHPSRGNWALEQAIDWVESGHEVLVVVPTPWVPALAGRFHPSLARAAAIPDRWEIAGVRIEYLRWLSYPWAAMERFNRLAPSLARLAGWLSIRSALSKTVEDWNPTLILAHHSRVSGFLAMHLSQRSGLPYVTVDHEVGDFLSCDDDPDLRDLMDEVTSRASACITVSKSMQHLADERLPGGRFRTLYNGSGFIPYERSEPAGDGPIIIFSCAKFYGRKDIPRLICAFDRVAERHPRALLRIAGDGPDETIVRKTWENAKHRDRVELLGLLTPGEVYQEMARSQVFALTGWAEPFGVVFLEAMSCGLPLIVCRDAGVAEVLENRKTALFTEPQDGESVERALDEILGDKELRQMLGKNGQLLYQDQFRWPQVNTRYLDVFHKVLKSEITTSRETEEGSRA